MRQQNSNFLNSHWIVNAVQWMVNEYIRIG